VSEEILINSTPTESRVALVENGVVQEVWLDRASHQGYVGNVYKGVVSRVLPGMQAAFIDIGLERTAFLHASDIYRPSNESKAEACNQDEQHSPEQEAIPCISTLVSEGSEIIVQVIKDPIGSKGARLSTNLSIPSRFLVLLPGSDTIAISSRIDDEDEKQRLKDRVEALRSTDGDFGYIVRTKAEGVDDFELSADMAYLERVWQLLEQRISEAGAKDCVYEDLSLPLKALRDHMPASTCKGTGLC
jgi:ribonuclease G